MHRACQNFSWYCNLISGCREINNLVIEQVPDEKMRGESAITLSIWSLGPVSLLIPSSHSYAHWFWSLILLPMSSGSWDIDSSSSRFQQILIEVVKKWAGKVTLLCQYGSWPRFLFCFHPRIAPVIDFDHLFVGLGCQEAEILILRLPGFHTKFQGLRSKWAKLSFLSFQSSYACK